MSFSGMGRYIVLKAKNLFCSVHLTNKQKHTGLNISEHGDEAYGEKIGSTSVM